ncbi:MAG: DUF2182 domain-containing protein [Gammaproteobacteria bacterium]
MIANASPSTNNPPSPLSRRDLLAVVGSLAALTLLAWAYLAYLAGAMPAMTAMTEPRVWNPAEALAGFLMWTVMMAGMMLPSASPMILLFSRLQGGGTGKWPRTATFVGGYLLVWTAFSAAATALQWGLQWLGLLASTGLTHPAVGGAVLVGAGLYQFTTVKQACLAHCQSPVGFLMFHWRSGTRGALQMGLSHGGYCLGCCWVLMLILFVGGVMNLLWAAGLAALTLVEKVVPAGPWLARAAGLALVAAGVLLAVPA